MSHNILIPFIVKVSVLGYFPLFINYLYTVRHILIICVRADLLLSTTFLCMSYMFPIIND